MSRLLFVIILLAGFLPAQTADELYQAGEYAKAELLYTDALLLEGADRGSLHYNLGNCAYRLEQYAQAVYQYRCAELYMPRNGDLQTNLRLARDELGVQAQQYETLTSVLLAIVDWFSASELLVLISLLETAGLIGFVLLRGNTAGRLAMLCLILLATALAARLVKTEYFSGPAEGMVLATQVSLRAEPHRSVPILFDLRAGESVRIAEQSERWARVIHARGEGWTQVGGIGLIR
ncbi:MAG: SH3 domain-containing protein [Planctomycetota bacterium]